MNGVCKTCGRSIVWVQRETGGWHRPLEKLDDIVADTTYVELNQRKLLAVLDGELIAVRAAGLYVQHECIPGLVEAERVDTPVGRWISQERQDATDAKVVEPIVAKPKKSLAERYLGAETVRCPRCDVVPNQPCANLTPRAAGHLDNIYPHSERVQYLRNTIGDNWPSRLLGHPYKDPKLVAVMVPWLRDNHTIFYPKEGT